MSGIELVSLAASVLQIADLGWKSSYKLYAFSKKVHDASKSIELVSQDIAATGAILKQLGDELKKDEENTPASRLGTEGLIVAASKLVNECQTLFKEIDQGISGEEGSKVILGFKQKLKWSYLEPRVDLLRTNLERLKSSLALMLNVLIYAEQHRSRQAASDLKEQQKLVASFAEQKKDSEKRLEELKRRIEPPTPTANLEVTKPATQHVENTVTASTGHSVAKLRTQSTKSAVNVAPAKTSVVANMSAVQIPLSHASVATSEGSTPDKPAEADEQQSQLEHHRLLIDNILQEVNSSKYALDHGPRYRLHDGVLELHWREWEPLRATHGDKKLLAVLSRSPLLARHWYERVIKPAELEPLAIRSHRNLLPPPIPGETVGSLASQNSKARENEQIMDRVDSEREERKAKQEAAFKTSQRMNNNITDINDAYAPKKRTNVAERAKYQFEADSEDEEMEAELEARTEAPGGIHQRLALLAALGTTKEMDVQENLLSRIESKSDSLSGNMSFSDPAASIADRYLQEWTTVKPTIIFNVERLRRLH